MRSRWMALRCAERFPPPTTRDYSGSARNLAVNPRACASVRAVFVLDVERVEPIAAPRYAMLPGTTEASQSVRVMAAYGVRPA